MIDCVRSELKETARECLWCLEQPESENRFTEFIWWTLFFSALSICMQIGISSEFTWLRLDLKIPAVGNRALPESDMCYNSLMSYLTRIKVRIDSYFIFFIISLLLFVCWLSVIFCFFVLVFFSNSELSNNVL